MKKCPKCLNVYPAEFSLCPKDGSSLQETSLWSSGNVIRGKYRIQSKIGEGGMATVFRAYHQLLNEQRALKVIHPELSNDKEFMARFKNEAIMARKLHHPNAVRVDDLDIAEDGRAFIAMELAEGETVRGLLNKAGPLPIGLVLDISYQICLALEEAHKLGMVHRDIKPDNIVLLPRKDSAPLAKILDFGISRLREEHRGAGGSQKGLTRTGMVIGTPEYMSPEQALGKRGTQLDGRSDLYSLGVLMYRMLTGELPFQGETTVEIILEHLNTSPKSPNEVRADLRIPPSVTAIVMKAMMKDRDQRYATAGEMAQAIQEVRGNPTKLEHKVDMAEAMRMNVPRDPLRPEPPGAEAAGPAVSPQPEAQGKRADANALTVVVPPTQNPPSPAARAQAAAKPPYAKRRIPVRWFVEAGIVLACLASWGIWALRYRSASIRSTTPGAQTQATPAPAGIPPDKRGSKDDSIKHGAHTGARPTQSHPDKVPPLTPAQRAKVQQLNSDGDKSLRNGDFGKASALFQQALDIDPANRHAWNGLQRCYNRAKNVTSESP
jgi:eukaryotic-like serine/threonine-protein kinase